MAYWYFVFSFGIILLKWNQQMYMRWATLSFDSNIIIVTPIKMLQAERENPLNPNKVKTEMEKIIGLLKLSDRELEARKNKF